LRESDEHRLGQLWQQADDARRRNVGDAVHLRGLLEISNFCARNCLYCGIRIANNAVSRYRMTAEEILTCSDEAVKLGYGTLVMQAGEDYGIKAEWLAGVISEIKRRTPLAVTLSLGERPMDDLRAWRAAGADRYLLRFETSNRDLYDRIHPPLPGRRSDRFEILMQLRDLGYEIGSGVMIGITGQSYDDLAGDIEMFARLDLEMIGVGPYIPHPQTPLGREEISELPDQVPADEIMTYKTIALARLTCPQANIPSTTALATINKASGRELALQRGANVIMPNLTPIHYRQMYEIYPGKACLMETAEQCRHCLHGRIQSIGRTIGSGRGDSPRKTNRIPSGSEQ